MLGNRLTATASSPWHELSERGGLEQLQTGDSLATLRQPGISGIVTNRSLDRDFLAWINAIEPDTLSPVRITLPSDSLQAAIPDILIQGNLPDH